MPLDKSSLNSVLEEADPSPERAAEFLTTLYQRRGYLIGEALGREQRGLRAELERREAAALSWALSVLGTVVKERR